MITSKLHNKHLNPKKPIRKKPIKKPTIIPNRLSDTEILILEYKYKHNLL